MCIRDRNEGGHVLLLAHDQPHRPSRRPAEGRSLQRQLHRHELRAIAAATRTADGPYVDLPPEGVVEHYLVLVGSLARDPEGDPIGLLPTRDHTRRLGGKRIGNALVPADSLRY